MKLVTGLDNDKISRFERAILPHLDAAYNLARWITKNEHDAEDVVQDAYLRAFRSFGGFDAERDGKAWLLAIVRNAGYTWLKQNRPRELEVFDEQMHGGAGAISDLEQAAIANDRAGLFRKALADLPLEFREALILRELEGLSYQEISRIIGAPLGTVMSRLARARGQIRQRVQRLAGNRGVRK